MCRSQAEGGQRCAAHLRGKFEGLQVDDPRYEDVAVEYASTVEGHTCMTALARDAFRRGDVDTEAMYLSCATRGEALREANAEVARLARAARPRVSAEQWAEAAAAAEVAVGELREHLRTRFPGLRSVDVHLSNSDEPGDLPVWVAHTVTMGDGSRFDAGRWWSRDRQAQAISQTVQSRLNSMSHREAVAWWSANPDRNLNHTDRDRAAWAASPAGVPPESVRLTL